jgi:hypothetical protein
MEKVKFKVVLGALSFAFFLFLGMNRVEAQVSSTTVGTGVPNAKPGSPAAVANVPQGNFVNADDARVILANEMAALKDQLAVLTPGNPIYTSVELHYMYYGEIDNALQAGVPVPNSIVQGLGIFMSDVYNVNTATLNQLRQAAISLLDN